MGSGPRHREPARPELAAVPAQGTNPTPPPFPEFVSGHSTFSAWRSSSSPASGCQRRYHAQGHRQGRRGGPRRPPRRPQDLTFTFTCCRRRPIRPGSRGAARHPLEQGSDLAGLRPSRAVGVQAGAFGSCSRAATCRDGRRPEIGRQPRPSTTNSAAGAAGSAAQALQPARMVGQQRQPTSTTISTATHQPDELASRSRAGSTNCGRKVAGTAAPLGWTRSAAWRNKVAPRLSVRVAVAASQLHRRRALQLDAQPDQVGAADSIWHLQRAGRGLQQRRCRPATAR